MEKLQIKFKKIQDKYQDEIKLLDEELKSHGYFQSLLILKNNIISI